MAKIAWLQLGRYGDLINILPLIKKEYDRGNEVTVFCSNQFKELFDGVSYCKVIGLPHALHALHDAHIDILYNYGAQFDEYIISQVDQNPKAVNTKYNSFSLTQWELAGYSPEFEYFEAQPLFDKRDPKREEKQFEHWNIESCPTILLNLTGFSDPLDSKIRENLYRELMCLYGMENVLHISNYRAERIYDLLYLIERAKLFITIDTGLLHLAAATTTPVIDLHSDREYVRAALKHNHVFRMKHSDILYKMDVLMRQVDKYYQKPVGVA